MNIARLCSIKKQRKVADNLSSIFDGTEARQDTEAFLPSFNAESCMTTETRNYWIPYEKDRPVISRDLTLDHLNPGTSKSAIFDRC